MSYLIRLYRRNQQLGHIESFQYDSDRLPDCAKHGFYDSPSKVPPLEGKAPLSHLIATQEHDKRVNLMASPMVADERSASPKRKGGWPKGRPRK